MCETAAKWIDSQARLQFRFFLNVFNCLLTTNLSRRNNRRRTSPQTLFNFRRNCNRQWISIKFHVCSRYLAATRDSPCSLDHDRMQITYFSFYDHDATQSECAHRLLPDDHVKISIAGFSNNGKRNYLKGKFPSVSNDRWLTVLKPSFPYCSIWKLKVGSFRHLFPIQYIRIV